MTDTIDLTPTPEGYAAIGATLVCQLRHDFRKARKEPAVSILAAVLDIAFAFGYATGETGDRAKGKELLDAMYARIGGRPQP